MLSEEDLTTHVAVFGVTGSGKSTTVATIVKYLVEELGIPVLIIDWHNEYRKLITDLGGWVFTPGKPMSPLSINPLDFFRLGDLSEHISLVTDIFADIFSFTPPQSYMFQEALYALFRAKKSPTLSDLLRQIELMPIKSAYDRETKLALFRRLRPLTEGQAGLALNRPSTLTIQELFEHTISIELGHFKELSTRKIFASILLKLIYDYRTSVVAPHKKHVTVIEEARNIVPARRPEDPPSIGERMLSELRKFGEGIIIVSQYPSQLSAEIIKSAVTRICHRIKTVDDRQILRGAMNLSREQAEYLHYLPKGVAIVELASNPYPFLVRVEKKVDVSPFAIKDDELMHDMMRRFFLKRVKAR